MQLPYLGAILFLTETSEADLELSSGDLLLLPVPDGDFIAHLEIVFISSSLGHRQSYSLFSYFPIFFYLPLTLGVVDLSF